MDGKKLYHADTYWKKSGIVMLISNSIIFKEKRIIEDKEGLCTSKKEQNIATCKNMNETHIR